MLYHREPLGGGELSKVPRFSAPPTRSTQPALVKGEVCPRGKQGPSCLQRRFSSAILPEEESHEKLVILLPSPHPSPQSTCRIFQFYRGTRASAQLGRQHLSVKDTLPWLHTPAWVASLSIGLFLPLSQSFSSSYLCLFPKASTCYVDLRETPPAVLIQFIKLPIDLITKSSLWGNVSSYLAHTSDIVNNCTLNKAIKFSCVSTGPTGFLSRKDN